MSGKRQHFAPQFLQRGFASHKAGDEVFTWVYRKGKRPFNANIVNVGVEGSFYTEDNDTLADDLITEAEGSFSELADTLRNLQAGAVSDPRTAILIAHLEIRTRHLRENFLQSAEHLASEFVKFMADGDSFADLLERKLRDGSPMMRSLCSEELAKAHLPPSMLEPFMNIVLQSMPAHRARLRRELPQMVALLRSELPKIVREAAKSGHLKVLKTSVAPAVRVQQYENLSYSIVDLNGPSLILGDSLVLFQIDAQRAYKTFLEKSDSLRTVYLPLAPRRVLVGTQSASPVVPSDLRRTIARCSLEHFISHEKCETNDSLSQHIGEDAFLLSKSQIAEIVGEALNQ